MVVKPSFFPKKSLTTAKLRPARRPIAILRVPAKFGLPSIAIWPNCHSDSQISNPALKYVFLLSAIEGFLAALAMLLAGGYPAFSLIKISARRKGYEESDDKDSQFLTPLKIAEPPSSLTSTGHDDAKDLRTGYKSLHGFNTLLQGH